MALWEYKVISSGKGGFATPALLESFLNQLGTEEWEIIEFRSQPDNPLAFQGLARRPTQRDWTLEAAAAAAAKVEADKLRAEFAAKFQAASGNPRDQVATDAESGNPERDESFRRPRDTDHDLDPYALDDSSTEEEELPEEEQLPTFFEAIRPHMRRNQKGPGYSVGVDYLVKKFEMIESDFMGALEECGFALPEDEDDKPVYIEYDGDLYWLNTNRRGELWINTREKPRQVFRPTKGNLYSEPAEDKPQQQERRHDRERQRNQAPQQEAPAPVAQPPTEPAAAEVQGAQEAPEKQNQVSQEASKHQAVALPEGGALLDLLRPQMRRSRGGLSGTISFLSRALKQQEAVLVDALATIGLVPQANPGEKAPVVEMGDFAYWLNRDGRGGIWINARDAKRMRHENRHAADGASEPVQAPASEAAPVSAEVPAAETPVASAEKPVVVSITPLDPAAPAPSPEVQAIAVAAALASEDSAPAPAVEPQKSERSVSSESSALAGVRLLLKEQKSGNFADEVESLASQLGKSPEEFLSVLVGVGFAVPEKAREKPVFVEHAGEVFWLNRNAKGSLWLNAKTSKYPSKKREGAPEAPTENPEDQGADKKTRRVTRKKRSED